MSRPIPVAVTWTGTIWRLTYVDPCPWCNHRHQHGGGDGPEPLFGDGWWVAHCPSDHRPFRPDCEPTVFGIRRSRRLCHVKHGKVMVRLVPGPANAMDVKSSPPRKSPPHRPGGAWVACDICMSYSPGHPRVHLRWTKHPKHVRAVPFRETLTPCNICPRRADGSPRRHNGPHSANPLVPCDICVPHKDGRPRQHRVKRNHPRRAVVHVLATAATS